MADRFYLTTAIFYPSAAPALHSMFEAGDRFVHADGGYGVGPTRRFTVRTERLAGSGAD